MANRAVFHATFTESRQFTAKFCDCNNFNAHFGEFFGLTPDPYTGELVITPKAFEEQTLECAHKTMPGNVVVLEVPYYETHNPNGLTAYIASEV